MLLALLLLSLLCRASSLEHREPAGAYGRLDQNKTEPGEVEQLGDLTVYRYGPAFNSRWVLWAHDIFGVTSGRTMEYCAEMAEMGVTCILPDFFRGAPPPPPFTQVPTWQELGADWEDKLVPYLKAAGAQSVAVVGTCYGSYVCVHASASSHGLVKGGIYFHPSHPGMMAREGEDEEGIYREISSPQAFMDTPDSASSVREGGLADDTIQTTFFDDFESPCNHGFFPRGDLSDPAVAECVERGLNNLRQFVTEYVINN